MPHLPMAPVDAITVLTPEALSTVLVVHFRGAQVPSFYGFSAALPGKRTKALKQLPPHSTLLVRMSLHMALREHWKTLALPVNLQTEFGQRTARDLLEALFETNETRLMQIAMFLDARRRTTPPPPPVKRRDDGAVAAEALRKYGRADDEVMVTEVARRFTQLSVREQEVARQAVRTIVDAFQALDRLTPAARSAVGPHGSTPNDDAHAAVDAALHRLSVSLEEAQRGDTESLRALRLYAQQWRPNDGPLHLS